MSDYSIDQMPPTEIELDRASHEETCEHPWIDQVCCDCGKLIGLGRMHPEEI